MKKISLIAATALLFALAACNDPPGPNTNPPPANIPPDKNCTYPDGKPC